MQEWVSAIPCLSLSFHMQRRRIKNSPDISVHSSLLASPSTGLFLISCLAVTLAGHTHFSSDSCGTRGVLSYLFSILDKSFRVLSCPESPGSCKALQGQTLKREVPKRGSREDSHSNSSPSFYLSASLCLCPLDFHLQDRKSIAPFAFPTGTGRLPSGPGGVKRMSIDKGKTEEAAM